MPKISGKVAELLPLDPPPLRKNNFPEMLEASKCGMKVGRIKDPLYKDSYFGITPPTFIPPFEAPENGSGQMIPDTNVPPESLFELYPPCSGFARPSKTP